MTWFSGCFFRWLLATTLVATVLLVGCRTDPTPLPSEAPVVQEAPATEMLAKSPIVEARESIPMFNTVPTITAPSRKAPTETLVSDEPAPVRVMEGEVQEQVNNLPSDPTIRRPGYNTSQSLGDLVKPHFFAINAEGELTDVNGTPKQIAERDGRIKVRLSDGVIDSYLDLLALESEFVGEHPVHKVYRLMEMGVPVADELQLRLEEGNAGALFANVDFEYQRRRYSSGIVAEVFPDGTLLVIPSDLPSEWQINDERVASPTHLHLNARAFSGGSSRLARDYELEILSLPFDDQRYPPAPLAKKQCDVYRESLNATDYRGLLDSAGFRFSREHATRDLDNDADFGQRAQALLWSGTGEGVQYFGFESDWVGDLFRAEKASWLGECDTAGGIRRYTAEGEEGNRYYLTVRRSLEPDKKQRYKILEVDGGGEATELYTAPGIMLMALPLPFDDRTWLFSTEGWTPAEGEQPADPRWQAVYSVNLDDPDNYLKIRYPIQAFPKAPEAGLYGASARMSEDGSFLYNTLYGFTDEGGGIWVVDVSDKEFQSRQENFARIVSWDHTLSWMPLGRLEDDPTALYLFMTGKEVADDFAMTANILRMREAGLDTTIEKSERLLQMVGWNPVPFGWQKLSDTGYRMLVETHYNYESSLLPRAKGVYIVPVDLTGE